ncbi:hypothetical protein NQ318_011471 [Aromia moschata]|uniref:Transposase n=1 Tax=Aromia moschata TaxID=1265417 RepID=A0AAV8XZM2_9CUCU|nr:hypothetical protein NQ318_011471 [Aromia moschata]
MLVYTTEEKVQIIQWYFAGNSAQDTIRGQQVDVDKRTVQNILRRNKYKPHKILTTQELWPGDDIRRMEFCEIMMEKANENEDFIKKYYIFQ